MLRQNVVEEQLAADGNDRDGRPDARGLRHAEVGQLADRPREPVGDDVLEHIAYLRVEGFHRRAGDPVEELMDAARDLGRDRHRELAVDLERPRVEDDLVGIARRTRRHARAHRGVGQLHA